MAISCQHSDASLRQVRPSGEQLRACSDIYFDVLSARLRQSQQPSFTEAVISDNIHVPAPAVVHSQNTALRVVCFLIITSLREPQFDRFH